MESMHRMLQTVVKRKVVGEDPTVIKTEPLEVLVARRHPEHVAGSVLTLETCHIQFPESQNMRDMLADTGEYVDIEVSLCLSYLVCDLKSDSKR